MTVRIRESTARDLEALTELRLAFLAEHRGLSPERFPRALARTTSAFFRRHIEAGTVRSWLAFRGSEPIFGVPHRRRRGIGARLMACLLEAARQSRVRKLMLYATADGRPLYRALGFAQHPDFMDLRLE